MEIEKKADELVRVVEEMRRMQKAYFRHRHVEHLKKSKELEKKVDKLTTEWWQKEQPKLF